MCGVMDVADPRNGGGSLDTNRRVIPRIRNGNGTSQSTHLCCKPSISHARGAAAAAARADYMAQIATV